MADGARVKLAESKKVEFEEKMKRKMKEKAEKETKKKIKTRAEEDEDVEKEFMKAIIQMEEQTAEGANSSSSTTPWAGGTERRGE